ncbi:hypothetical protein ACIBHY_31705 [Nonomuraea sp. NPDC050547]
MPESTGPWRKADPLGGVLSVIGITVLVWATGRSTWPLVRKSES